MDWWVELGHEFGRLRYKTEATDPEVSALCKADEPTGYIVLFDVSQTVVADDDLAQTVFCYDTDGPGMLWSRVYLPSQIQERLLEHEMGHALGYLHLQNRDHIMHPRLSLGGWESSGLRASESHLAEATPW